MAKVFFRPMRLDFAGLQQIISKNPTYEWIVFQPVIDEAENRNDFYKLIGYLVNDAWTPIDLIPEDTLYYHKGDEPSLRFTGVLQLSNYPLNKSYINSLPQPALINHLYLEPLNFPRNPRYVRYGITEVMGSSFLMAFSTTAGSTYLNPSPPAPPGDMT